MNYNHLVVIYLLSNLLFSGAALADDNETIGVGAGVSYNGLGLSYGFQAEDSLKYISVGCLSIAKSDAFGTELNCGVGMGIVKTNVIHKEGKKHGLGVHVGATYNEYLGLNKIETFVAPQYIYFVNGIDKSGANLGGSIVFGKFDGVSKVQVGLQVGYQF